MTREQFKLSESGDANARLEKAIGVYEDLVYKAEQNPDQQSEQQLHDLMNAANNVFRSSTGKWPAGLIEDTYMLIKRVGIIAAEYDEATGVKFVRLSASILLNHLSINDGNRPLIHVLLYDKANFNFVREIKYEWLGKKGMAKMNEITGKLYEHALTLSEQDFSSTFLLSGFERQVDEILRIDPLAEKRTTDARPKILLNLLQHFQSGLVPNPKVSVDNKKKIAALSNEVLQKVPGLFADKRVALAEGVGLGLKDKVKAPKRKKGRKVIDTRLTSERVSQKEHEYVSIPSVNPDDVIIFDYKESDERVLAMPEIMKIQLNSLALIGDLAAGYWRNEGGDRGTQQAQFAVLSLDDVQKDLVNYYRNEKYDGKTPFKLAEGLKAAMSIKAFGEIKNLAYSSRISDVPFRSALLNLVDGKPLQNMDEVKEAGLAVAWLQRNRFDDFMSARGLMSKLLHKEVMIARGDLPEDVQKKLYGDAYTDAGRFMRNLLADGDHMKTFRANFPDGFREKFGRSPTEAEINDGAKGHISALWEAQHVLLYDSYLTWAALSKQYMKPDENLRGVDKAIYDEFCKSVDPDGGKFRLDDRAKATLYPIMKEVGIMALSFGAAWVASSIARVGIGLVRGASLFQKTTRLARLAQYAAEGGMVLGKTAFEAGAFSYSDAKLRGNKTFIDVAIDEDAWKAAKMISGEMAMFGGFHVAGGVLKFLKMGAEGRVLMKYSAGNTKHAKVIDQILALAKNSPAKAIEVMDALVKNGGKIAEIEGLAKLGKGVLPKEVLESFGRSVSKIELMTQQYRIIIGKITDPRIREILGKLVFDLNFDAAAIMIGTYAKEYIDPKDRPKVEATLWDHYKEAYLTAGVFKAVFGGLGKVVEKLPAAVEKALPKAMRERLFKSYRNAKGEFIGRDGLVQMLTEGLEGEGFESAIAKMEEAKVLILTANDVLFVTSKLPREKRTKFLDTCKRIMKPGEKQLFSDNVAAMKIEPSDIPKDFSTAEIASVPVEIRRRVEGELQGARARAREAARMPAETLPPMPEPLYTAPRDGGSGLDAFRDKAWALKLWLNVQIAGAAAEAVIRMASPEAGLPAERPAATAMAKPGDFAPEGRFNLPKERVAKMHKASEKSKVVLVNSNAKTPESSLKDFSEFDFSISQDSIFEGMKKDGVDLGNIEAMKAAYASLPDIVKPYYRVFGANVDGKFEHHLTINNEDFAKNAEKIMHAGLGAWVAEGVAGIVGWAAKGAVGLSWDVIVGMLKESSTSVAGAYGLSVLIAWIYFAAVKKTGKLLAIPPAIVWPAFPILKKIKALKLETEVEAKPLKPLPEIIAALHLDGITPANHYGLDHADAMQLDSSYESLKPVFENLKGSHGLFDKVIQALFVRLRLRRIHSRLGEIRTRKTNINGDPHAWNGPEGELTAERRKIAERKAEVQRLIGVEETKIGTNEGQITSDLSSIELLEREASTLSAESRRVERTKETLAGDKRAKVSEVSQLRASVGSDTVPVLEGKIRTLEREIPLLPKDSPDIGRKEAMLGDLKAELNRLRRIDALNNEIRSLDAEIASQNDAIDRRDQGAADKLRQKPALDRRISASRKEIEKANKEIEKLQDEAKDKALNDANKKIEELQAELKELDKEANKLHDEEHGLGVTLNDPTNGLLRKIITDGWKFNPDKRLKRVDMKNAIRKVLTDNGMPDEEAGRIVGTIVEIVDILLIHGAPGFRGLEKSQKLVEGLRPTHARARGIPDDPSPEGDMANAMRAAYRALQGDVNSQWEGMNPLEKGLRGIDKALPHHPGWRKFVIALILSMVAGGYYYFSDHTPEKKDDSPTPKVLPSPGAPGGAGTGGSAAETRRIEQSPFPKGGNPTKWTRPPVNPANARPNGAPVVPTEAELTDLNKKATEAKEKAGAPKSTDEDQSNAEAAEAAAKQAKDEISKAKKAQEKEDDPAGIDDLRKAMGRGKQKKN